MTVNTAPVFDILLRMRDYFQGNNSLGNSPNEEPFRSELYNSDQMESHAKVVAKSHTLLKERTSDKLLKRLGENVKILIEVRNLLVESIRSSQTITPGA